LYRSTALDEDKLQQLGITHVLNAAKGQTFTCVNTDAQFYKTGIIFHGIPASDVPHFEINTTSRKHQISLQVLLALIELVEKMEESLSIVKEGSVVLQPLS
jgi:hypothetical protein